MALPRWSRADVPASVPDPRARTGRVHPSAAVLSRTAVAVRAGMTGREAIARFGRDHGPARAHAPGFRRGQTPAPSARGKRSRRPDEHQAARRRREGVAAGSQAAAARRFAARPREARPLLLA
jgi:hypothetical protein